jgi:hypothetical protein
MRYCDVKVAVFPSQHLGGDVELWYCSHSQSYRLKYDVAFYSPDGLCSAVALAAYGATDYDQVVDVLVDAIDIARTPLLDRD